MYCDVERRVNTWSYAYSWPGLATTTRADDAPTDSNGAGPSSSEGADSISQPSETASPVTKTTWVISEATPTTSAGAGDGGHHDGEGNDDAPDEANSSSRNSSTWAIVGGVLGGALVVALLMLAICICRRKRGRRPPSVATPSTATHPMMSASPYPPPLSVQPSPTSPSPFAPYGPGSIARHAPASPDFAVRYEPATAGYSAHQDPCIDTVHEVSAERPPPPAYGLWSTR